MKDRPLYLTIGLLIGIVVMQWTMPSGQASTAPTARGDTVAARTPIDSKEASRDAAILVLGWVLGIVSSEIHGLAERKRDRKGFVCSTKIELEEVRLRLAIAVQKIRLHYGMLTEDHAQWYYQQVVGYDGPRDTDQFVSDAKHYRDYPKNLLGSFNESKQRQQIAAGKLLTCPPFEVRYLDANLHMLRWMKTQDQVRLLRIRTLLQWINDLLAENATLNSRTFAAGLDASSHSSIRDDQKQNLDRIANYARDAADEISRYTAKS